MNTTAHIPGCNSHQAVRVEELTLINHARSAETAKSAPSLSDKGESMEKVELIGPENEAEQNTKPLLDLDVNNQLLSKYLTVNAHFIDYWLISSNTILHDWDSWRLPPTELLPWETSTHY
ncbi:hypothetical protein LSH36_25g09003 [Paralvinella palmiformis]|uniref:Uncharacterized protein n=1 Tax=Paralvinella palmiformis TaxID=53620 RepID=A0AAD9NGG4_9ANNE|nr:hypothetical protein LSH36_25g09003 [Paralvinella palmiformis]